MVEQHVMHLMSLAPAVKPAYDIIRDVIKSLHGRREEKRDFWISSVLDPMQTAMASVHDIYMKTFHEALMLSVQDGASISELLEFLRDRNRETLSIRENLQALRNAVHVMSSQPPAIRHYLSNCERYFVDATGGGVSTPLRELLGKLEKKDHVTGMSLSEIENIAPRSIRKSLIQQIREGLACTKHNLNRNWPDVLQQYHAARLEMLRP